MNQRLRTYLPLQSAPDTSPADISRPQKGGGYECASFDVGPSHFSVWEVLEDHGEQRKQQQERYGKTRRFEDHRAHRISILRTPSLR